MTHNLHDRYNRRRTTNLRHVADTFEVVNILEGHRDIDRFFKNPA